MKSQEKQRKIIFVYNHFQDKYNKTKLQITSVDRIQSSFFMDMKYSDFMVTREDGQKYYFSEADFPRLEPRDLLFLLRDLKTRTNRPREVVDALETVKRYMKCAMKLSSIVPVFTVLKLPEFGMTYVSNKGVMRFIRLSQIARFCDGTLMLLKDKLKRDVDKDEKGFNFWILNTSLLFLKQWALLKTDWSTERK
ncbi:hypothetical protein L6452_05116 [Arctium lappa]|uniref:Uncharacterized protein n=1 Tax=Arctium lappa TaxID=4217 RepID=A0ACB9EFH3_ARCLA|nr:hypothetical protein L6452_05116 [Arctium lappa]